MTSTTFDPGTVPAQVSPTASAPTRSLRQRLVGTGDDATATLLRLALGIVMFPHGAQKVLGWFGGYGFSGTMAYFTEQAHIPALFAFLAITAEFAGSLGLISGFLTRVAAFGILCNMVVAVAMVHASIGLMMNWYGQYPAGKEGFEYHILAGAIAIALMVRGGGKWSVDRALSSNAEAAHRAAPGAGEGSRA